MQYTSLIISARLGPMTQSTSRAGLDGLHAAMLARVNRKEMPNSFMAGQAPTISERMMPPRMSSTEIAQARVIQ